MERGLIEVALGTNWFSEAWKVVAVCGREGLKQTRAGQIFVP